MQAVKIPINLQTSNTFLWCYLIYGLWYFGIISYKHLINVTKMLCIPLILSLISYVVNTIFGHQTYWRGRNLDPPFEAKPIKPKASHAFPTFSIFSSSCSSLLVDIPEGPLFCILEFLTPYEILQLEKTCSSLSLPPIYWTSRSPKINH